MQVTFLTRKFPPARGGMETFSFELTRRYPEEHTILHHGQRQRDIVWAAPLLLIRALLRKRSTALYHLGDLVLVPLAPLLSRLTKRPIVVTVHALELLYDSWLLQWFINRSLDSVSHFVAVSSFTRQLLVDRGVSENRISVIPHGVEAPAVVDHDAARKKLDSVLNLPKDRLLICTVGRLIRRKGVAWFIEHVLPQIQNGNPLYLMASCGPDHSHIESVIQKCGMSDSVRLLGKVSDDLLRDIYAGVDMFVVPNIRVPHDAEGFGFVAVEAAAAGLPVIAARLEGITEAIHQGENGTLVEPEDADAFVAAIAHLAQNKATRRKLGQRAREYTKEHFRWDDIAQHYADLFDELIQRV